MPKKIDLTLRQLQEQLPWTVHYDRDFRASPVEHKDFQHALIHVLKAAGKLAAVVNDAEHAGTNEFAGGGIDPYVADLVVCALRMANTCPGRWFELQDAVEFRIETKNDMVLKREPPLVEVGELTQIGQLPDNTVVVLTAEADRLRPPFILGPLAKLRGWRMVRAFPDGDPQALLQAADVKVVALSSTHDCNCGLCDHHRSHEEG